METIHPWYTVYLIGTYAAGFMWGMASVFLFPETSQMHQLLFCLIMAGLAAGAITTHSSSTSVAIGFLSIVLLPLGARMLTLDAEEYRFLSLLIFIFWVFVLIGSRKIHNNIKENIELRLKSTARENQLKISEERYRHLFNSAPVGILQYDKHGIIIDCNNYFVDLIGSTRELLIGFDLSSNIADKKMRAAIMRSLTGKDGYFEGDYRSVTGNKKTSIRAFFKALQPLEGSSIHGMGIVEDFTEKKQFEEKLYYHATYDSLTGLPNRRLLQRKLEKEISRAIRYGHIGALLFIDLDNFKTINDSLGHAVGDDLLKLVAQRIRECIRQEDAAARMGGDEFVIILTELDSQRHMAANKAQSISEEIRLCLSAPCTVSGYELRTSLSIGISLFPKPEKNADDILKQADTAMYRAKSDGRNTIRFFSPDMQKAADERLQLTLEIQQSLQNDEFILYYQPQVDAQGYLVGAEALLRWNHPQQGLLSPARFLETAEETGLMPDIGKWVLNSACSQITNWCEQDLLGPGMTISINISGKELSDSAFFDTIQETLTAQGTDPARLGIELTEGSLITTNSETIERMIALQQLGIKLSIDDFGTGYSSLNYLNKLPLNTLKIDRSFVQEIKDKGHRTSIVDTIIVMAHNLGLEAVAEGVESVTELNYLQAKGCSVYQGYYFSKPLPPATFTQMLRSANKDQVVATASAP